MADTKIAVFGPSEGRRIWSATEYVEKLRGQRVEATPPPQTNHISPLYFQNISASTIPAWGCIQHVGTTTIDNVCYVEATVPIQWDNPSTFLFNYGNEVEPGGFGYCQQGESFRTTLFGTTPVAGLRLGPFEGSCALTKGCLFQLVGLDSTITDGIRVVRCTTNLMAQTNSIIAPGMSGLVTVRTPSSSNWSPGFTTYEAWNDSTTSIRQNARVLLMPVDAKWIAVEVC
jgi:hypothetical protein